MYGSRIHIINKKHHSGLSPIWTHRPHILIQIGDKVALGIFELELQKGHERSISGLDVLFDWEDRLVEIVAGFNDFKGADIVLDGKFDGGVVWQGLHLKWFKFYN